MKLKALLNSFKYAFMGIISSLKSERNMKIHFSVMTLVIIFGFLLKVSLNEWCILIILFGLVISAEMFNTAIENVVDIVSPKKNELAKLAKDISAGAVLINAFISVIVGLIIFIPKIIILF